MISAFEEHGEVLPQWITLNYSQEVVLFFDQHLDFKKISQRSIDRALQEHKSGNSLATLNRHLPFAENDHSCFGLDNFLFLAAEIGLLKRLIWVFPEKYPLSITVLKNILLKNLSLVPGYTMAIYKNINISEYTVNVKVGKLILEITTLQRLKMLDLPKSVKVDIDLDYFCNVRGEILEDPDTFVDVLKELGITSAVNTMSYSISSGFLAETHRWLGDYIAKKIQRKVVNKGSPSRILLRSIKLLADNIPIDKLTYQQLIVNELEPLGGPGASLSSLLALQMDDVDSAITFYENARSMSEKASLPAYKIALSFYKNAEYEKALVWFKKTLENEIIDTLHSHSLCFYNLCLLKLNKWQEACDLSKHGRSILPLRHEFYNVAIISLHKLKLGGQVSDIKNEFQEVKKLYDIR